MSINKKTFDFLKQLLQQNPDVEEIELEFMQLSELVSFLPILIKFSNLRKLSLHGNRIKELPLDLSQLQSLEELDVSNNMLNNCDMMIMSLRTLPKLKRLVCPFKKEDEQKIKRGLPQLEYINNSKIEREKPKPKEQVKRSNPYELQRPRDLDKLDNLFKKVRTMYMDYEQYDDTIMVEEYQEEVGSVMRELDSNLERRSLSSENVMSVLFLTTKYSLYKVIQDKLVTFFTDIDEKYGQTLEELFEEYSSIIHSLAQVGMTSTFVSSNVKQAEAEHSSPKVNKDKSDIKLERLEREVDRLRKAKDELLSDINALEAENKKFLDALVRHSKGDRSANINTVLSNTIRRDEGSPRRMPTSVTHSSKAMPAATQNFVVSANSLSGGGKPMTLKQLKDIIQQIYESKVKFDQKSLDSKQSRETMYQYLFTFLNQKYGLKNLIIEYAGSIVSGIQTYLNQDNDVAVFGKILRNECDEEFRLAQADVKLTIQQLLKMHVRSRMPYKTASEIKEILDEKMANYITAEECEDIVRYVYSKDEAEDLIEKLKMIYALQPRQQREESRKLTRQQQSHMMHDKEKKRIKYSSFVKCVLDFQLRLHERKLRPLVQVFKRVDRDSDGIVDEDQFSQLMQEIVEGGSQLTGRFLNMVDPYSTNKITFSQVVKLLDNYPQDEPILSYILKNSQ